MATGASKPNSGLNLFTDNDPVIIEELNPLVNAIEANAIAVKAEDITCTSIASGVTIRIAKAIGKIVTISFEYKPTSAGYNTDALFVIPVGFRPISHFALGVASAASASDLATDTAAYINNAGHAIVIHQGSLPSNPKVFSGTYIAG